jgi:hypothetical protein
MTVEIFENRKNSMDDYLIYLNSWASTKLESAVNGENGAMMEYNTISLIKNDLVDMLVENESNK